MLSLLDSSWFCEIDWLISVKIFLGAQRNELFLTNWCFAHFRTVTARCFFPMSHWQGRAKKTPGATEPINNNPRHSSCAVHPSASKNTTKIYSLKKIVFYIKETFVSLFLGAMTDAMRPSEGKSIMSQTAHPAAVQYNFLILASMKDGSSSRSDPIRFKVNRLYSVTTIIIIMQ